MKLKQFESKPEDYHGWINNPRGVDEDDVSEVTAPLQIGSKIRTKKMSTEGQVIKIGKTSYGTDEVVFRTMDGRTLKTPASNVVPVEKLQDGGMGGINRSRPATDVSYEKVLDEVIKRWMAENSPDISEPDPVKYIRGKDRVDQKFVDRILKQIAQSSLNIYNVMNEPQDAAQKAAARVLTRMYDQVSDEHNIGNDDFEKISGIILQQLQQKFGIHEELDYVLERWNKFNEDDDVNDVTSLTNMWRPEPKKEPEKKGATRIIDFHGWTIRTRQEGKHFKWGVFGKDNTQKHGDLSTTEAGAIEAAEEWIKSGGGTKQQSTKDVTIDFNQNFRDHFTSEGERVYVKFSKKGNVPIMYLSIVPQEGFKKTHPRTDTQLPMSSLSAKESNEIGLQPNGRYLLGDKEQIDDNISMFPLIFQSVVQRKGDMKFLGRPGLTVAHRRD